MYPKRYLFHGLLTAMAVASGADAQTATQPTSAAQPTPNAQPVGQPQVLRTFDYNGYRYQEIKQTVSQPIRDVRYVDQLQTYYAQRFRTDVENQTVTRLVPKTEYECVARLHDWWRVFGQPYVAYYNEPYTTWQRTTETLPVPVTRREVVPQQRTVKVATPYLRYEPREQISYVAIGYAPPQVAVAPPVQPQPPLVVVPPAVPKQPPPPYRSPNRDRLSVSVPPRKLPLPKSAHQPRPPGPQYVQPQFTPPTAAPPPSGAPTPVPPPVSGVPVMPSSQAYPPAPASPYLPPTQVNPALGPAAPPQPTSQPPGPAYLPPSQISQTGASPPPSPSPYAPASTVPQPYDWDAATTAQSPTQSASQQPPTTQYGGVARLD